MLTRLRTGGVGTPTVNGNPISCFDPFGLFAMCWLGANWHTISWIANLAMLTAGILLTATGAGAVLGVPLIVAGATGLTGDIMHAVGVESRTALQILAAIDIIGGTVLLFTPFALVGASMIGSGVGSENLGQNLLTNAVECGTIHKSRLNIWLGELK